MTIKELQAKRREINDQLSVYDGTLQSRELTADEKVAQAKLEREYKNISRELSEAIQDAQARSLEPKPAAKSASQQMREVLKGVREGTRSREIVLGTGTDGDVASSGAISLSIHDIIPTLNEGLGLPAGLSVVTGVTGNEIWPVSLDDAAMQEIGETVALTPQDLHFDNISPVQHRVGLSVHVSNMAIDNAAFDLLGYVQQKFTLALRKYMAEKLYSQAAFTGNKGPFSGATPKGTITIGDTAFKDILEAVAKLQDDGYDVNSVCLVMDAATEARLKSTPKAAGQGGFVIENGKCAGYDYVVSHYINTTLDTEGTALTATDDKYIGIGLFPYEAVQQHGEVRLTIDATSDAVASKNVTSIVFNTSFSFTDLSVKTTTNGKKNTTTTAFALYKIA